MNKHTPPTQRRQQGSIVVLFGGLILVLTGFAVLAIDVGRVFIVRGELQNVADSAALAGANCLTRNASSVSPSECLSTVSSTLNWDRAGLKAQAQLSQNQADNRAILSSGAGHAIDVGYWDLLNKRPSGGTLTSPLSTTFSPIGAYDKPAIRVTVRKADGQNGGPVLMLTRLMFGGNDVPMSATSVAVISSPGGVPAGNLLPMAINKCLFDTYWDSANNTPYNATASSLNGVTQVVGQPWVFRIGSAYHYGSCDSGQWTSFGVDSNSAKYVEGLIIDGNPTELSIGDGTYIQPGAKTSNYNDLLTKFPMPAGADVLVPVVNYPSGLDGVKSSIPIVAFALFRITAIQGGSGKYIQGYFKGGQTVGGTSGVGPSYGVYTPPRLAY